MSLFQDQVAADLGVFLPLTGGREAEFDTARDIDGEQVACILDDAELAPTGDTGVFASRSKLHLRAADLSYTPVITQRLVVDGKPSRVIHVDEAMGMLTLTLEWSDS